jgi:hypothetical protein
MPRRSSIYTNHIPTRIETPTFPLKTVPQNPNENPQITEQSTYSEILATFIAPKPLAGDSVEEYDDWIKAQKTKQVKIPDDILSVTPQTASLIKKYNKKARKAAKVDKFKVFQEGRDGTSPFPSLRKGSGTDGRTATTILPTSYTIGGYSAIDEA